MSNRIPQAAARQTIERIDPDEKHIVTVRRHPFGIFALYVQVAFGFLAAGGLAAYLLPSALDREENADIYNLLGGAFLLLLVFMVLILFVATVIYYQSKLVVTDRTITQITQDGLFNRKVSQLGVANIEDVTANRRGIFQSMLNFGILTIETAGEQENFHYYFCPDPDHYAKLIFDTREAFLSKHPDQSHHAQVQHRYAQQTPVYDQQVESQGYTQQPYAPVPPAPQQPYPPQQAQYPEQYSQQYQPQQQQNQPPVVSNAPATPETDYREPA